MTTDQVLKHYGTPKAATDALGLKRTNWNFWLDRGIPPFTQCAFQVVTKGKLKADPIKPNK